MTRRSICEAPPDLRVFSMMFRWWSIALLEYYRRHFSCTTVQSSSHYTLKTTVHYPLLWCKFDRNNHIESFSPWIDFIVLCQRLQSQPQDAQEKLDRQQCRTSSVLKLLVHIIVRQLHSIHARFTGENQADFKPAELRLITLFYDALYYHGHTFCGSTIFYPFRSNSGVRLTRPRNPEALCQMPLSSFSNSNSQYFTRAHDEQRCISYCCWALLSTNFHSRHNEKKKKGTVT